MTAPAPTTSLSPPLTPLSGVEEQLFNELTAALAPRIQVVSLLGRGGMALVFLGRDPLLKRSIAIKVLSPQFAGSDVARTRFTREAQAAATMTHPNVAAVYDVGELPTGTPYFLMQFLDGKSLADVIASDGMFAEQRARRVIGEVASALAMAHQHGLVHRDVKPANVIIENESQKAVVVDFGISSAMNKEQFTDGGGTLTAIGTYVGTPRYTSPEQAASEPVTGKTDVYSLGVVAYELLTGKVPFDATNPMALLAAHIKDVPPPIKTLRPDVDASFAAMIDRCLQKDPAARPDASEIASFLLPEPQAAMEWPPPGLDDLRGQGARTAAAFNWFGAFASAFVLALATQPTRGTSRWAELEQSLVWSMVANMWADTRNTETPDASPVWLFVLFLAFIGASVGFVIYVLRAFRLFGSVRHGQRQGYSLPVLAAVAADGHSDTSDLLNRRGRYAVLTAAQQQRLVEARRLACVVLPGGFLLLGVLMLNWFAGLMSAPEVEILFTAGHALLMFLPVALGAVLSVYLYTLEMPLRSGSLWGGPTRMAARAEFVRDWLRRLKNPEHLRFAPVALVIPLLGLFGGASLLFALGVSGLALTIATRNVSRSESIGPSLRWNSDGWNDADRRFVESLHQAVAPLQRAASSDSAVRLFAIEGLRMTAHLSEHVVNEDAATAAEHRRNAAGAVRALTALGVADVDVKTHWHARNTARGAEAAQSLRRLREFGRAALPERVTATNVDQFPPYMYPTEDVLQLKGDGQLEVDPRFVPGEGFANAQCDSLLAAGRSTECRAIMSDLLLAAHRLAQSPDDGDFERSASLALGASRTLARVAAQTKDAALAQAASRLELNANVVFGRRWSPQPERHYKLLWAFAGSLDEKSLGVVMLSDPRPLAYERWLMVENYTTGFCANAREILFGVSPRRHAFLREAARRGPPRTVQWVRIHSAIVDRWIEDPDKEFQRRRPEVASRGSVMDVVKWVGMRKLHARLRFCSAPGLTSWR